MQYIVRNNAVEIIGLTDFEPVKIFECGQCFRWNSDENGVYFGVAKNKAAKVWKEGGSVFISGSEYEFNTIWRDYFDLDRDYMQLRASLETDEYMKKAISFGTGIRILRQDKWEALCSFIISQCNNIPRIKKIIETLCECFGEPICFEGKTLYTFPDAAVLAGKTVGDLDILRCGYRAQYIIEAAKAVASGKTDLDKLAEGSYEQALGELKKIRGIGDKVANCVILFGLSITNAFPIDVWMKKALAENYNGKLNPEIFGNAAGLAQQYIFYYARSGEQSLK